MLRCLHDSKKKTSHFTFYSFSCCQLKITFNQGSAIQLRTFHRFPSVNAVILLNVFIGLFDLSTLTHCISNNGSTALGQQDCSTSRLSAARLTCLILVFSEGAAVVFPPLRETLNRNVN